MIIALALVNLASPRIPNISIEVKCVPMSKGNISDILPYTYCYSNK